MSAPTDADLLSGFSSFVDAARRLEDSYSNLQRRAASVDLELARTNRRLTSTLAEREAVFEALPVGVAAFTRDGSPIWSNREADRLAAELEASGESLGAAMEGERTIGATSLRLARLPLPDGGTLVMLEDRSRVVGLEREVQRLDRLAALSELALGVAHEIKNPLNGVMGYASLIARSDDPVELRRYASRVSEGLEQVDRIVKAMLAFARPNPCGDQRATARLVGDVVRDAALEAGIGGDAVEVRGDLDAAADGVTLSRVLANLFRNSAEAVVGRAPRILVQVRRCADERLELLVEDDGPGVPESLGDRVFEPFVTSKSGGHGLGLALAARVLSFLGGAIELLRDGVHGARFRVVVPAGRQPELVA